MVLESIFASEYSFLLLSAIALMGLLPEEMRPAALTMNIVVTSWLLFRFQPYKLMPTKLFWPLVIASTPLAFVG